MEMTMKRMQIQLLLAYQISVTKPWAVIEFRYDIDNDISIIFTEFKSNPNDCKMISICGYKKYADNLSNFKKMIAVLNGEMSLFDNQTAKQRDINTTEGLF